MLTVAEQTSTSPGRSHQEYAKPCVISDLMRHHRGREPLPYGGHSRACPLRDLCLQSGDSYSWSPFDDGNGRRLLARQIQDVSRSASPQQNVRLPIKAAPYFAALGAAAVPTLSIPQRATDSMSGCQRLVAKKE